MATPDQATTALTNAGYRPNQIAPCTKCGQPIARTTPTPTGCRITPGCDGHHQPPRSPTR